MSSENSQRLLILGASTRAAAASAARAGFYPVCADRFGDADLRRIATVIAANDDLRRTVNEVKALPPMPWIYTGSVENDPKLIASVNERHSLLGNAPDALKKVRDPFWLERMLRTHDLPALSVRSITDPPPTDERWLLKPTRGGGGCRIAVWSGRPLPASERFHFQERRMGTPMSALFIAWPDETPLIGVCEQLIGPPGGAPTEFGYAGSIGPIAMSHQTHELLQRLGNVLSQESNLRGLFGIDFVFADDVPWLVELNPRYTASVEVLERATGRTLLAEHTSACDLPIATIGERHPSLRIIGKQIVFAIGDVVTSTLESFFESDRHTPETPLIADIPASGTRIVAGWPICTVFAEAASVEECRLRLAARSLAVLNSMRT